MKMKLIVACVACFFIVGTNSAFAQEEEDDLMNLLEDELVEETTDYTTATFKTTRIITSRSIEMPSTGEMQFIIAHRFGRVNSGWRDFFGLDNANIRFGLEYGIAKWLSVGFGRSNVLKYWDGFARFKILRQSTGKRKMPITVVLLTSVGITSAKWTDPTRENLLASRVSYAYQLMIARKFHRTFSLQLMPTMVHRNLVVSNNDKNDIFSIGAGARQLITKSMSINMEYFYLLPNQVSSVNARDAFSIGLDFETGGHVFQIMATNALGMVEQFYVGETTGRWLKGDIHLGFNVNRVFTLADTEKMQQRKEQRRLKKEAEKAQ